MSDSSLPVETLEVIIEDFISEYTRGTEFKFLPRWYLVPLLRVCKLWRMVSEKYLYRSISIGRRFAHDKVRIRRASEGRGYEIGYRLMETLSANSRLAAMVEEFGLISEGPQVYWSRRAALLFDICPNLQHVELRGLSAYHLGEIIKSLKEKSLVSFRISLKKCSGFDLVPIFELMQRWPRLQMIRVKGVRNMMSGGSADSLASGGARNCCAELREINFTHGYLGRHGLRCLRYMCNGVTRLGISVLMLDDTALVGCLQAWSPTLQCVRLHIRHPDSPYPRLSEALSALRGLEELQIIEWEVDFGAISDLPQLKRLCYNSVLTDAALGCLANHLASSATFAALEHFAICCGKGSGIGSLGDVCAKRNIKLQMWDGHSPLSEFLL